MSQFQKDLQRLFARQTAIGIACLIFIAAAAFLAGRFL